MKERYSLDELREKHAELLRDHMTVDSDGAERMPVPMWRYREWLEAEILTAERRELKSMHGFEPVLIGCAP